MASLIYRARFSHVCLSFILSLLSSAYMIPLILTVHLIMCYYVYLKTEQNKKTWLQENHNCKLLWVFQSPYLSYLTLKLHRGLASKEGQNDLFGRTHSPVYKQRKTGTPFSPGARPYWLTTLSQGSPQTTSGKAKSLCFSVHTPSVSPPSAHCGDQVTAGWQRGLRLRAKPQANRWRSSRKWTRRDMEQPERPI